MPKIICKIFPLLLLVVSCAEPDRKDADGRQINDSISIAETPDITDGNNDTLLYEKYRYQYEQVSYESLDDTFLKKALEKYFVLDDEGVFYDYTCKNENTRSDNSEHAKDYSISLKLSPFDSTNHTISRAKEGFVYLIDGKVFWGTDGGIPQSKISALNVTYKGVAISIPQSEYNDLFSPFEDDCTPDKLHLTDGNNSYIVFVSSCSDGAGYYTAVWIFKDGKYIRRVVDSSC